MHPLSFSMIFIFLQLIYDKENTLILSVNNGSEKIYVRMYTSADSARWTNLYIKEDGNGRVTIRFTVSSYAQVRVHMKSRTCTRVCKESVKEAECLNGASSRQSHRSRHCLDQTEQINHSRFASSAYLAPPLSLSLTFEQRICGPSLFRYLSWNALPSPSHPPSVSVFEREG